VDFPLKCPFCGSENWVDLDNPTRRQVNNLVVVEGYVCQDCTAKIPFFYTTRSMDEVLAKLKRCKLNHPSFPHLLRKAIRKSFGIREKYGAI
jgi:transposase-like protein